MEATSTNLSRFVPIDQYRVGREHVYPSDGSVRWAARINREKLLACNALAVLNGRLHIDPEPFDRVVVEAGVASVRGGL